MIERYTLPEMGAIWSLQNKFQKWLDVEIAVCEVHAEDGIIPAEALAEINQSDRLEQGESAFRRGLGR
jgi:adenylosuccinate lyase